MIGWGDVYKVAAAMAPLYFALALGYGSVRRWKLFTPDQCGAINRLVVYFAFPFFGFDLAARAGSFAASRRVLAADVACKALVIVLALAGLAAARRWSSKKGGGGEGGGGGSSSYSWCITGFSLAALNNALLMGIPLLDAMYGAWAHDVAVQMSMMQIVVWFPLMLVVFEARQAWLEMPPLAAVASSADDGGGGSALEEYGCAAPETRESDGDGDSGDGRGKTAMTTGWCSFWAPLLRTVALKLAYNPNVYASLLGVAWSSIASRWHLELPSIVEGSVAIMSKTGIGLGMFSMGLFIALQEKFIMCSAGLTALSLVLRFVVGPAAAAAAAAVLGIRGDLLRFTIVQAALPPSVATFNFAREYNLHADVLSTAIIVGTLASLPVLIAYYVVLGLI